MSLFDRYDQNEAEVFLRDTCFIPTPQRRFEDLFEQIHQHFQHMQIFSNSDDSLRSKEIKPKNINPSNEFVRNIFNYFKILFLFLVKRSNGNQWI